MMGRVTLVGAGPGARGLLTLRGAQVISAADVVVYDRLVGQEVLDLVPDHVQKVDVGKSRDHHPVPQEQINDILVAHAKEGKHVVRLKGGDCYLFGRGGEEAERLAAEQIPFEVVPGITSALAAPAYAGIPATHREYCSSVHFITAHARAGAKLDIDFDSLVKLKGTIVFLMGLSTLEFLMNGLLHAGINPSMPASIVENGTRYNQRKLVADVSCLASRAAEMNIQSPSLVIVGEVCTLSDRIDWFVRLPLHGKCIVVTRPRARSGTLSERLRTLGAGVIEYPCIETEEITESPEITKALSDARQYSWIVLTSPAGVTAMLHALQHRGMDLRAFYGCKFAVIGSGTAAALAECGITADYMPDRFDAHHLGEGLCSLVAADERVLLLRALQGTAELTAMLTSANICYDDVGIYRTVGRNSKNDMLTQMIAQDTVDYVMFTSASTVDGFMKATPGADVSRFTAICIGDATAAEAKRYDMKIKTAKNATLEDLVKCILEEE